jgi:arylsulfatase A-like enzyme
LGYSTGLFGKWHLGSSPRFAPNKYGFDASYGSLAGGVDPYNHHYKKGEYSVTWHRDGELVEEHGHVTDLIVREALDWIDRQESPWFCYVPFTAVHIPVKAPHDWLDRYAYESFDDDPEREESFRKYAAYTSHMDDAVGKLIDLLKAKVLMEDTLIVFASDNGAPESYVGDKVGLYPGYQEASPRLGSNLPYRGWKSQLYEGGVRTPAVVSWQGSLGTGVCNDAVHIADWFPTITDLAGGGGKSTSGTGQDDFDGTDMWNIISRAGGKEPAGGSDERAVHRDIYWNTKGKKYSLIRDQWKLISDPEMDAGKCELFNLVEDAYEATDIASDQPDTVNELLQGLKAMRELDDTSKRPDAPNTSEKL